MDPFCASLPHTVSLPPLPSLSFSLLPALCIFLFQPGMSLFLIVLRRCMCYTVYHLQACSYSSTVFKDGRSHMTLKFCFSLPCLSLTLPIHAVRTFGFSHPIFCSHKVSLIAASLLMNCWGQCFLFSE